jgi:hypothetical protein
MVWSLDSRLLIYACRLSTHTPEYLELVMLRISGVTTFTKYLVKPSVQNGVRLGLLGSTLRAGHWHVRRQFPPVFVRHYAQPPGGNGFLLSLLQRHPWNGLWGYCLAKWPTERSTAVL